LTSSYVFLLYIAFPALFTVTNLYTLFSSSEKAPSYLVMNAVFCFYLCFEGLLKTRRDKKHRALFLAAFLSPAVLAAVNLLLHFI